MFEGLYPRIVKRGSTWLIPAAEMPQKVGREEEESCEDMR